MSSSSKFRVHVYRRTRPLTAVSRLIAGPGSATRECGASMPARAGRLVETSSRFAIVLFLHLALLFPCKKVTAQTTLAGGRGMLRVQSAKTVQAGSFVTNSFFSTFFHKGPQGNVYDHTWNFGLTYGLTDHLEAAARILAYQDDQRHRYSPPGYTELSLKWNWPRSWRRVHTGVQGRLRLPTAQNNNVPFEPYSSGNVGWGASFLASYDVPGRIPLQLGFNFGYFDHDIGTFLKKGSTDQIVFGAGFKVAARAIIFYTEYTGEIFLNQPGLAFRNNSMRLTHGVKFRAPFNLLLDIGGDVGLSRLPNRPSGPVHEYADWKLFAGLSYHFITPRVWGILKPRRSFRRGRRNEDSLRQLRDSRQNVDETLDEMLRDLEKEQSQEKDDQKN